MFTENLIPQNKHTISDKQLAANRANAQKSTGPTSETGKQRSSLNTLRHGLTAQVTVMTEPDREAQELFCRGIIEDLNPQSRTELQLAQAYATLQWRINRVASLEENVFTLGRIDGMGEGLKLDHAETHDAMSQARTFLRNETSFNTLSLYGQRLVHQAEKILKQLAHFQDERKPAEPEPEPLAARDAAAREADLQRAVAAYRDHAARNLPFDPRQNGFVCSLEEIQARVRRESASNVTAFPGNRAPAQEKAAA